MTHLHIVLWLHLSAPSLFVILQSMNPDKGISSDEACRMHVLAAEDFARMCNKDGSLKTQPSTTTFYVKDDPSKSITIDNNVLYVSAFVFALLIAGAVVLVVRRLKKKKL